MKKEQWIDLIRGIKKSKGRYISLLFIVALGTAFFAGVRSAEPDMIASVDKYYDESNLMDVRILGTLGLTEADVEKIEDTDGIDRAEGGYATEALAVFHDSEKVVSVLSACDTMNQMTIWKGRMPEAENECFMDEGMMMEKGYELGDTITLTNEEGEKPENLVTDTFTIVGSGTWSWYLSWNRGTASIGDGTMDAFMIVPEEAFDMDCYTVIYAMVNGAKGMSTYSEVYEDAVDLVTERVEEIAGERCEIRYTEIYEDAEKALSDAKEKVHSGEQELKDAEKKLEDGEAAYQEGKRKYDSGVQSYQEGKRAWEKGREKLEIARVDLEAGKQAYETGVQAIEQGEAELETGRQEIEAQEQKLEEGETQLLEGKEKFQKAEEQIAAIKVQVEKKEQEYEAEKAEYESQLLEYEEMAAKVQALETELSEKKSQEIQIQEELASLTAQLEQIEQEEGKESEAYQKVLAQIGEKQGELALVRTQIATLQTQYDTANAEAKLWKAKLDRIAEKLRIKEQAFRVIQYLFTLQEEEFQKKKTELEEAERQIAEGKEALRVGKEELEAGARLIEEKRVELEAAKIKIAAGEKEIRDGEEKLQASESQLLAAEKELDAGRTELLEARKELEEGWKAYKEEAQKANEKLDEARSQIADGEKELVELEEGKWYVLGRDTIQNSVEYGMDAKRIGAIGNVFPVIFFLVAALVSLTTMTRMIEEERTLIGTMKALGYSKISIASKYILYAFSATLIGGVAGVLIGSKVLPFVVMQAYGMLYSNVQYMLMPLHWDLCILAIGMAMVCTVGAAFVACYKELMAAPAALMRPPAPKQGKRVFLERLPFIWNHLNFSMKSTIRNLLRYKKRFFMTVFGIGGCMALLLVSFGLNDSVGEIVNNQYKSIWTYSAVSGVEEQPKEVQQAELDEMVSENQKIESGMLAQLLSVDAFTDAAEKTAQIYVIEDTQKMQAYLDLHDRLTKEKRVLTDEGVILSEKLAKTLEVEEGDSIMLPISDTENAEVTVTGIVENYMFHYIYMTPAVYEKAFGEIPEYNEIFFKFEEGTSRKEEQAIVDSLLEYDSVMSVSLVRELQETVDDMMNALNLVVWVLIISAGLLVFVVLYNLNNINISERRRELASLKVLGFSDMEVAMYVYRENIFLTFFGVIAGVFFGTWLHKYLILTLEVDMIMFGRQISLMSYGVSILLTIVFAALVNVSMFYKLRQIDMVESLKSVE